MELITASRIARLSTIAADGRPHLAPVCFAYLEGQFYVAIDEKPKRGIDLARVRNIRRDPRVTLLFDIYDEDWSQLAWVRIDGSAEVLDRGDSTPLALAVLRERYAQYALMALEERPLIRITPQRVVSWRASGSP